MLIGSLFSGVGGLEYGLEMAGLGETIWQVEKDEFCRRVLAKHWPAAERFNDVCTVGATTLPAVDLVCGGFPCQDVSSAGKRAGLSGARSGLWYEYRRVVSELRPSWVVVENVASGASKWLDTVREHLGEFGYVSLPIPLAASDVGAPHRRGRIFVVAYANSYRKYAGAEHAEVAKSQAANGYVDSHQFDPALGEIREGSSAKPGRVGWGEPQPDMVRVVHGVRDGMDSHRRRALGNAVVPQQAEVIGHIIRELAQGATP